MSKRIKTKYPGVYYREGSRAGGGVEKIYYVVFKKYGRMIEEKVGRQFQDDMTPAKAAKIRSERMEGARKSRREVRLEKEAAIQAERSRWTLGRLWDEFYRQKQANKSIRDDFYRWRAYLEKDFNRKTPDEIITLDVDRVRHRMAKKGYAPATIKQALVLLKRIVNFGVKKGLCPMPDLAKLHFEMPKVRNERTEDLTPDQLQALLKAIEEDSNIQAANLMKMALFSGLRRGELFRLKWSDINYERGFILLRDTKAGEDQKILFGEAVRELLEAHPRTGSEYVFPGRGGRQRTDVRKQVDRIKRKAGLPKEFRPLHGLRHVYASMLASSGEVSMYALQKLLRHKTPSMTQRYAHLREETLQRATGVADKIIEGFSSGKEKAKVVNLADHKK